MRERINTDGILRPILLLFQEERRCIITEDIYSDNRLFSDKRFDPFFHKKCNEFEGYLNYLISLNKNKK